MMKFKKLNMNHIIALIIDITMLILSCIIFIRSNINWYIIMPIAITGELICDIIMIYKFKNDKIYIGQSIMTLILLLFIVATL